MIDAIIIDLCAALLAPELRVRFLLDQADKDGLRCYCYAQLPRDNVRRALKIAGLLQGFYGLFYDELMSTLLPEELRMLSSKSVLWLRHPNDVDYKIVLAKLSPRQRRLPKALRQPPA